jgi:hypothetical protein
VAHPQLAAFARMAKENAKPARLLAGQKTLLGRTMHDIRYDAVHDEIIAPNPFAQAVLVFRGGASGEEAPIRVLQGEHTLLQGKGAAAGGVERLDVDAVHNEIFVPADNKILVYSRTASGDTPPIRVIEGADTKLKRAQAIAVDPVHDVVVAGTSRAYQDGMGALIIFSRTDAGNVKPRGLIMGPKSEIGNLNQIAIYAPKGWIVATQSGDSYGVSEPEGVFVGIWSIQDNGDVPPRWKLGGPQSTIKAPRGVALDEKTKELMIADRRLNAVLTFSFPELF